MLWLKSKTTGPAAWRDIRAEVNERYDLLSSAVTSLGSFKSLSVSARIRIAATDVFVEKAQYRLSARAKLLLRGGITTGLLAVTL